MVVRVPSVTRTATGGRSIVLRHRVSAVIQLLLAHVRRRRTCGPASAQGSAAPRTRRRLSSSSASCLPSCSGSETGPGPRGRPGPGTHNERF